jgi:lipopolysaccharide/colanic/teichoic acid biosynthesis glycosyltransferase
MREASRRRPATPGKAVDRTGNGEAGAIPRNGALFRPAVLVRKAVLPTADAIALAVAVAVSGAGRTLAPAACYAAAVLAVLAVGRLHRLRVCLRASDQTGRILAAAALPLPVFLIWTSAPAGQHALVTGPTLAWLVLAAATLIVAARVAVCAGLRAVHRRGLLTERTVVVGAGTFGGYLAALLQEHPELGLRPVGFVDDGLPRRDLPVPVLGGTRQLADIVSSGGIERIIVCFSSDCRDEDLVGVLRACRPLHSDICVTPRLYELGMAVPMGCLDEIWGVPLMPLRGSPRVGLVLKRGIDLAVALVLGLVGAPLALALGAAIRMRLGSPVLFRQVRLTGAERVATIVKLRTLPVPRGCATPDPNPGQEADTERDAHWDPDTAWTVDEARYGWFCRWLRATHLDELPQLLNVLRGEMSLVGPRPERPYFARQFAVGIPRYADRTRMPCGLTGWAQVNGLNGDTSVFDRARFDNYYAEYWSPWLDAVILARTAVLVGRAALGRS